MSSKFNCSVKINGHTFDIIINDINSSPTFSQIYPKIREIIKIGANEDVNIDSHDFQIFETPKKIKWIDESLDQIVVNKSLIAIESKPQLSGDLQTLVFEDINSPNSCLYEDIDSPDSCLYEDINSPDTCLSPAEINRTTAQTGQPQTPQSEIEILDQLTESESENDVQILIEEPDLQQHEEEIKLFYSIVMSINIGWDLRPDSNSGSKLNWKKVAENLKKIRPDSNLNYLKIEGLFYHWSKLYSNNYNRLNDKLVPKHQQIFDLLKIVHILDLDQLFSKNDKIHLNLRKISNKNKSKQYFNKHLAELRQEKVDHKCQSTDTTDPLNSPQSVISVENQSNEIINSIESQTIVNPLKRLVEGKNQIKLFQSIVMAINIGWDLRSDSETNEPHLNWQKVTLSLQKSDIILEVSRVSIIFFEWTEFYALIFDLLKIVHILDLNKIYENENNCRKIIESISENEEFIAYFDRHLAHLKRDKVLRSVSNKSQNNRSLHNRTNQLKTLIEEPVLESQEFEIKRFQTIVMAIEHSLRKPFAIPVKSAIRWVNVVERLRETDSQFYLNNKDVKQIFHLWIRFYVNNYDRLNDKLVPKHQQIFDLLKIVHILDLERIHSKKEDWGLNLAKIFQKTELQQYYNKHLNRIKAKTTQIVSKHKPNATQNLEINDNSSMMTKKVATSSTKNQTKSEEIKRLKKKLESLEEVIKNHLSNCESNCCKKVKTDKDIEIVELV